jgi:hypothetical protein
MIHLSVPAEVSIYVLNRLAELACVAASDPDQRDFKNRAEELLHLYAHFMKLKN